MVLVIQALVPLLIFHQKPLRYYTFKPKHVMTQEPNVIKP